MKNLLTKNQIIFFLLILLLNSCGNSKPFHRSKYQKGWSFGQKEHLSDVKQSNLQHTEEEHVFDKVAFNEVFVPIEVKSVEDNSLAEKIIEQTEQVLSSTEIKKQELAKPHEGIKSKIPIDKPIDKTIDSVEEEEMRRKLKNYNLLINTFLVLGFGVFIAWMITGVAVLGAAVLLLLIGAIVFKKLGEKFDKILNPKVKVTRSPEQIREDRRWNVTVFSIFGGVIIIVSALFVGLIVLLLGLL